MALGASPWLLLLFVPLLCARPQRLVRGLFLAVGMALYALAISKAPSLPEEGVEGRALLHICDIQRAPGAFGQRTLLKCRLKRFEGPVLVEGVAVTVPVKGEIPSVYRNWLVEGRLKQRAGGGYSLKVRRWEEQGRTFSLGEVRYRWRAWLRGALRGRFRERGSADFLAGMVTGEFVDPQLFFAFNRLGLQHLMAISGFHFSLMAALLGLFVRPLASPRRVAVVLVVLLSLYFLLVGPGAAVQRAWIMAAIAMLSLYLGRRGNALNALGVALGAGLIVSPRMIGTLGFQFSYGCTGALLLFHAPMNRLLARFLGRHGNKEVLAMGMADQHGFALLALVRRALGLIMSVNLVALPLTLFYFGEFPLLGLVYNLFFPALVAVAMVTAPPLLLLPGGAWVLETFTTWTLDFARYAPEVFDLRLRVGEVPLWMLGIYFSFLILLAARPILGGDERTHRTLLPSWA